MGLGVVGAVYTNESDARVSDMTPIARLIEEQEGLARPGRLAVRDRRRPRRGVEGRPRLGARSAAARRPAGPTTCSRCSSPTTVGIDPTRGQLHLLRRRRPAHHGAARREDRRRHVRPRRVRGPDRRRLAARARRLRRGAARRRRRPDPHRVGHRPGLHQLARRPRAAGHLRRGPRRSSSTSSPRCTTPTRGRRRSRPTAGSTTSPPATSSATFLEEQDERVADTLKELGLA